MSEALDTCQALAALVQAGGTTTEEEVRFVGHAAFDLGLSAEENQNVEQTLKQGGDYAALLSKVKSRPMRQFLFRRVVAAALLDEQVTASEQAVIQDTAKAFDYDPGLVEAFVCWMREGIQWEKRGAELMARLG